MTIDFSSSDCHWHVGAVVDGVKQPDELHVKPRYAKARDELTRLIGKVVRGEGPTRYRVEREEGGVFILTSTKSGVDA